MYESFISHINELIFGIFLICVFSSSRAVSVTCIKWKLADTLVIYLFIHLLWLCFRTSLLRSLPQHIRYDLGWLSTSRCSTMRFWMHQKKHAAWLSRLVCFPWFLLLCVYYLLPPTATLLMIVYHTVPLSKMIVHTLYPSFSCALHASPHMFTFDILLILI